MKRNTRIFIKTSALVAAFMLLLGAGIMSLTFSHTGTKPNDNNFLTPDLAITAPTSQELLQKKFNAYNTVTEENGKSVVTIFSEEQIKDILARREKGEWFWLSSEEMLYLINDTVKLFEEYDVVRIWVLEGNAKVFEYDDKESYVYDVILERVKVLSSAVYTPIESEDYTEYNYYTYTDIKYPPNGFEELSLILLFNQFNKIEETGMLLWIFSNTPQGKFIYTWESRVLSQYEHYFGMEFWAQRKAVYPIK